MTKRKSLKLSRIASAILSAVMVMTSMSFTYAYDASGNSSILDNGKNKQIYVNVDDETLQNLKNLSGGVT